MALFSLKGKKLSLLGFNGFALSVHSRYLLSLGNTIMDNKHGVLAGSSSSSRAVRTTAVYLDSPMKKFMLMSIQLLNGNQPKKERNQTKGHRLLSLKLVAWWLTALPIDFCGPASCLLALLARFALHQCSFSLRFHNL